jgi:hypothetical protein
MAEAHTSMDNFISKANLEASKSQLYNLQVQTWMQEDGKEAAVLQKAMQQQKDEALSSIISRGCRTKGVSTHAQGEQWMREEFAEIADMSPRMDVADIGTILISDLASYGQCWSSNLQCILQTFINDTISNPANTVGILVAPTMPVYGTGWQDCGKFSTWGNKFNHGQSLPR